MFSAVLFRSDCGGNPKELADGTDNKKGEKQAVLRFLWKSARPQRHGSRSSLLFRRRPPGCPKIWATIKCTVIVARGTLPLLL
jgi:hypothetical protein